MKSLIDFDKFKGKKVKLVRFEKVMLKTKYNKNGKWFCKIFTEVLDKINKVDITASRFLPMETETTWKKLGDLQNLLDHYKVKKIEDLIGKEVEIIVTEKEGYKKWLEWKPV